MKVIFRFSILLLMLLSIVSCSNLARHRSHGNKIEEDKLADIKIGEDTMEDVRVLLGPPTNRGTFDKKNLYYVFQYTEQKAFFDPKIIERRVVKIELDDDEVVKNISILTEKDGKEVEISKRESPTVGKDLTILQQMMGNVGKFRKAH